MPLPRSSKRKRASSPKSASPSSAKHTRTSADAPSELPGKRGARLILHALEDLAIHKPEAAWLSISKTDDPSDGFADISYKILDNAVNRAAKWLGDVVTSLEPATVAYLGPSDARYPVLMLAAMKVGHCLLLISPHNAIEAQQSLLKQAGCAHFLYAAESKPAVTSVLQGFDRTVTTATISSLLDILSEEPVEPIAYSRTWEDAKDEPFVRLHTSGTTGSPKLTSLPHSYYAYEDLRRTAMYTEHHDTITSNLFGPGCRTLGPFPMFHIGGVFFTLLKPLLNEVVPVVPPANVPITAELMHECFLSTEVDILHMPPSLLSEWANNPKYHDDLKDVGAIMFGSGPMPRAAGDKLLQLNQNCYHFFGLTETDLLPLSRLDDPVADWSYHHFHPLSGVTFEAVADGLHELVIKRLDEVPQPCFAVWPESNEFRTGDLFARHPTKPTLWRSEGRVDDMITLSTGHNINPTRFEEQVASLSGIRSALVVGRGRRQSALLVELDEGFDLTEERLEGMWDGIEAANTILPKHGRISRQLYAIASQSFERTPKKTVKRQATESKLRNQIMSMYAAHAIGRSSQTLRLAGENLNDVQTLVREVHTNVLGQELHADGDIFAAGVDSLKVAQIVHSLNAAVEEADGAHDVHSIITPAMLYQNRNIARISEALHRHRDDVKQNKIATRTALGGKAPGIVRRRGRHQEMLGRHLNNLPLQRSLPRTVQQAEHSLRVVVLTGSTGSLGTHLLHALLRHEEVQQVHCLDRSPNARSVYVDTFPNDESELGKVHFHSVQDLNDEGMGLDKGTYQALQRQVSHIVHNAWPVHFHLPLVSEVSEKPVETLDTHVGGVASLIKLAATAETRPRIVFISSLAAVLQSNASGSRSIPEEIITDPEAPHNNDYARSKWMAEQVLEKAAVSGVIAPPIIVRPGQIAGPLPDVMVKTGSGSIWSTKEVIPSLVLSSKVIGALPADLREKDKLRWTPVNVCARSILELAEHKASAHHKCEVYHLTNLHRNRELTWSGDLLPIVKGRLEADGQSIQILSLGQWLLKVKVHGVTTDNPASLLLDFYEDLLVSDPHSGLGGTIEISKAESASPTFEALEAVKQEWMVHWMQGWSL